MDYAQHVDVPSSARQLLQRLWNWHGHNPVNCFECCTTPQGILLVHPASQASVSVAGEDLAFLLERGWLRGREQLMLTNAGLAACRRAMLGQLSVMS